MAAAAYASPGHDQRCLLPLRHGHALHRESQLSLARLGSPFITAHCTLGLGVACGGVLGKVLASGAACSATT